MRLGHDPVEELAVAGGWRDDQVEIDFESRVSHVSKVDDQFELVGAFVCLGLSLTDEFVQGVGRDCRASDESLCRAVGSIHDCVGLRPANALVTDSRAC